MRCLAMLDRPTRFAALALLLSLGACGDDDAGDGTRDARVDDGGDPDRDGGTSRVDMGGSSSVDTGAIPPETTSVPAGCDYGGRPVVTDDPLPHASGITESVSVGSFTDEYLYDATGTSKIGFRDEWGSSIVFFGGAGDGPGMNDTNTIDANDTGREVQVALYDPDRTAQGCSWNASCETTEGCPLQIRYLGWNPVQGGNRCNTGSPTDSVRPGHGRVVASTVPLQWNPDWDAMSCDVDSCGSSGAGSDVRSDVRLTQTVRFVAPRIAEVRYTVENLSDVDHRAALQEMPTLYTAHGRRGQDLWRLMDPNGTEIPIDTPSSADGFFYENFTASGPWVSLQNDDLSYGVAILYENDLRDFQGWQERDLPFNNVRSRIRFGLPGRGVVHARAYLLVGSFAEIQSMANELLGDLPPFGWLDGPGEEIAAGATTLSGWALDNRGVVSVEARIDESVTVPLTFGQSRADVCAVWPGYPQCDDGAVGFNGSHTFEARECPHLVEVIATDTDGNRRTIAERLVTVR